MPENPLAQLLQIEQNVRKSESLQELLFVMVNETRSLVEYEQAGFFQGTNLEKLKLISLSDTPVLDRTAPIPSFIEREVGRYDQNELDSKKRSELHPWCVNLNTSEESKTLAETPPNWLWVPLIIPSRPTERLGVLWLAKSSEWTEKEIGILQHLASSYAHALQLFYGSSFFGRFKKPLKKKVVYLSLLLGVLLSFMLPVRLSVLAPAEITAKQPVLVTAPLNGTIKEVFVLPGQTVQVDEKLALMEDVQLKGDYQVSQREYAKALAELRTAEQAGFRDSRAMSRVAELEKLVELKHTQLSYAKTLLEQTEITAKQPGLVIMNDPETWQGRPVSVGEKIMTLANPERVQIKIQAGTRDAIGIEKGSEVRFFMDIDPLNPINATVRYSVYEPQLTEEQVMAYKVIADIELNDSLSFPRIGLKGTAKLYGEEVSLFFYLFRRPITTVRQWVGW